MRERWRRTLAALAAAAALALGGCSKADPDAPDAPPARLPAAEPRGLTPPPATVDVDDRRFLQRAASANAFEHAAAELAAERGTAPSIRRYAETVLREHAQLAKSLSGLAEAKKVELPQGPLQSQSEALYALRGETIGHEFDEHYAGLTVRNHDDMIALYRSVRERERSDGDVRELAGAALEILQRHREMADDLGGGARMP